MQVAEMLAREAIRYTMALYNQNGDTGDYDNHINVFHPDAEMVIHHGRTLKGATAIIEALRDGAAARAANEPGNFQRHHLTTSNIELTSETTARTRHYIIVTTELGFDHTGAYDDEFIKHGERWLIGRRQASLHWARDDSRFVKWLGAPDASLSGSAS